MRSLCTCLAGTVLAGVLVVAAPGCDGGGGGLEKPPDVAKKVTPENDMPGFKDMQEQLKAKKK